MNRLKFLREEKGLYLKDIAEFLGTSITAITYYENEKRDMSPETIIKLSEYFGVSTDYLLGKSDIRNIDDIKIDSDKIQIGLSANDYENITDNQKKQIEEFAKLVLKDNMKNKDNNKK